jgi:hypothetical protein
MQSSAEVITKIIRIMHPKRERFVICAPVQFSESGLGNTYDCNQALRSHKLFAIVLACTKAKSNVRFIYDLRVWERVGHVAVFAIDIS